VDDKIRNSRFFKVFIEPTKGDQSKYFAFSRGKIVLFRTRGEVISVIMENLK